MSSATAFGASIMGSWPVRSRLTGQPSASALSAIGPKVDLRDIAVLRTMPYRDRQNDVAESATRGPAL